MMAKISNSGAASAVDERFGEVGRWKGTIDIRTRWMEEEEGQAWRQSRHGEAEIEKGSRGVLACSRIKEGQL